MDKERVRYHLKGKGFSGRGVELVELDPLEIEKAELCAAKELGKEATLTEVRAAIARECMFRMIKAVTKKDGLASLDGAEWTTVRQQDLEDEEGPLNFAKLFRSKDAQIIRTKYRQWHDATDKELDDIEGGAQAVSAD